MCHEFEKATILYLLEFHSNVVTISGSSVYNLNYGSGFIIRIYVVFKTIIRIHNKNYSYNFLNKWDQASSLDSACCFRRLLRAGCEMPSSLHAMDWLPPARFMASDMRRLTAC